MVFATAAALARRARRVGFEQLTTKLAKKGFYKGKGAVSPGVRARTGAFKVVPWKRPDYVVPRQRARRQRVRALRRARERQVIARARRRAPARAGARARVKRFVIIHS